MDWIRSHALPLVFLSGYLILLAYHGWRGNRRSKELGDYLVGGRGMGGVVIALSFYATFVSSVTFVGHAGKSFTRGPAWWLTCVIVFTVMVGISWFVVAPPFMKQARQLGALTIPEFLGLKYRSNAVRRLSGIVVIAASLVYMVAVYDGAARSLEVLFAVDRRVIMVGIFLIVTLYTLSGGFHSVVATDAVQGVILFGGALLLPLMMIVRKGGLVPLLDSVRAANPTALDWTNEMPLVTMIGLALGVGLKLIVEPRQLSRFYGLASDQQLRRGRWIAPILLFVTYLCMLPVGFLAHAFVPRDASLGSDQIVPFLLGDGNVLGPIAGAFFLTALVAAAMSSLDSVLLVAASSVDHDVIGVRERSNPMLITRCWVLVLSAVAAGLALVQARGIVEMSSFSGSIYAACFLPSLVVGLFWKGGTRAGALAGICVGFAVTTIWFYAKQLDAFAEIAWLHELYLGLGISLPTFVIVSKLRFGTTLENKK